METVGRATLVAGVLAAARAIPLAWALPSLAPAGLDVALRALLAFLFAAAAWPLTLAAGEPWVRNGLVPEVLLALLLREVTLGLALGFVVSRGVRAAEVAGGWLGRWSRTDDEVTASGDGPEWRVLFGGLAVVLFLRLGGLAMITRAFLQSYAAWPVAWDAHGAGGPSPMKLVPVVFQATARLFESAFGIAAPVLVATWLADLLCAVTFRIFGWAGATHIAQAARPLLVVGVLLLSLGAMLSAVEASITEGLASAIQAAAAP